MKNIGCEIFSADKPGGMNAKFSTFTPHHRLLLKSSAHNFHYTNTEKSQCVVQLFEEDSLMTHKRTAHSKQAALDLHSTGVYE